MKINGEDYNIKTGDIHIQFARAFLKAGGYLRLELTHIEIGYFKEALNLQNITGFSFFALLGLGLSVQYGYLLSIDNLEAKSNLQNGVYEICDKSFIMSLPPKVKTKVRIRKLGTPRGLVPKNN